MNCSNLRSCAMAALMLLSCALPMRALADDAAAVKTAVAEAKTAVAEAKTAAAEAKTAAAEAKTAVAEVKAEAATTVQDAEAKTEDEAKTEAEVKNPFSGTFWALVPPLVAIGLALITKEVYSSLFIGIVLGGIFVGKGQLFATLDAIVNTGLIEAVKGTAGVFIFLVVLGIVVTLLRRAGAARAFGEWAKEHVKSRVGAILATSFLGILIFIDDYFNCLAVGSVMLPVTDSKKISRAKLAYIIDATAAPICMIAPVSSWAAAVSSYAEGTQYSGIELFIRAIPYNFYSLLTIIFIVAITVMHLDFGPMARHEKNAIEKGDLFTEGGEADSDVKISENPNGRISDLVLPIIILICFCVFGLLYVGGIMDGKGIVAAFSDTDATVGLPWGGLAALVLIIIYFGGRNVLPKSSNRRFMPFVMSNRQAMECVSEGFIAMVPAILILTMATSLKNMTGALEAKEYIGGLMANAATGLDRFLPMVIFLVACVLAFATGTSWGTFGILIPIVVHIFPATSPLLFIGMSACLAGAVCGDHCSPISDTTIMSSAGARCQHINHVSTQLPYAIFVAVISCIGFLMAGFINNWYIVFPCTVALMLAGLGIIKLFKRED